MWVFYTISEAILYAITNVIEKYVVDKHIKDPNILVILGGIIVFFIGLVIFLFLGMPLLPLMPTFFIISAGIFLAFYLVPYFKALALEDASTVIPLFGFAPIMNLFLSSLILGEKLTSQQFIGFFVILFGGLLLSVTGEGKGLNWLKPRKVLFLVLFSSLIGAMSNILFKLVSLKVHFWTTLSYEYIGVGLGYPHFFSLSFKPK